MGNSQELNPERSFPGWLIARLLLFLVLPFGAIQAGAQQWIAAWSVAQGDALASPAMNDTSVRMIVRPTLSGGRVRVKLENTMGQFPVEFSAAYIGQVQAGAALASNVPLFFQGQPHVTLAPGDWAYSDPLPFPVQAFQRYAISLDVKSAKDISAHVLGLTTNYMASGAHAADTGGAAFGPVPDKVIPSALNPTYPVYWVAALDVEGPSTTGAVVALGDSITDGECSTRTDNGALAGQVLPDLYQRWTDLLAARLAAAPASFLKAVADEGIAGNRVVTGGAGPAALARLDRDVLHREGVSTVILFEGTNDIANGQTAAAVIAADRQIIQKVRAAGLKIVGATLIPRGGETAWTAAMEQERLTLNDWIRHQAGFDGLLDFDEVMEGPINPANNSPTIPAGLSCYDGIHPNAAGYAALAASIDLDLFRVPRSVAPVSLSWIPGSSVKVEQLIGDTDYQTHLPTLSQSFTRAQVFGTDLGYSFEHNGQAIFLFGDTLHLNHSVGDTIAGSSSLDPAALTLDFFLGSALPPTALLVLPQGIAMGPDDVPDSGISLFGAPYVVVKTNHSDNDTDKSVLTRFDETSGTFPVLRDPISSRLDAASGGGKFIEMALHEAFVPFLPIGPDVVFSWGAGEFRKSDVYLSSVLPQNFETGAETQFFTGFAPQHGRGWERDPGDGFGPAAQLAWSDQEADANAVVADGTVGNVSVTYAPGVGLWIMTYDSRQQGGVVFRYARSAWGRWSPPQVIFDPARDGAYGLFIHDPAIVPDDGLDGPTIGNSDPLKTRGADYAPYVIERFTRVENGRLKIFYTLSTWNPYTVVEMESDFAIRDADADDGDNR